MNNKVWKKSDFKKLSFTEVIERLCNAYSDFGYDIEVFDETTVVLKSPIQFIVSYIDSSRKLNLPKLYEKIINLDNIANATGIKNHIIISKNGFSDECYKSEGYSIRLEDMSYVERIITSTKENRPIELLPHNQVSYKKLLSAWQENRLAAIVQATGTGKSYIIAKTIQDRQCPKSLILCPTLDILTQFENVFSYYNFNLSNIDFMTYAKLARLSKEELSQRKYELIFIDEFHRAGANKWRNGVERLIKINEDANILGTTATPIRYLDDRRNMADELFDNNVVSSLDLFEAIARGILPTPKYIEAIYDIESDLNNLSKTINSSNIDSVSKRELLENIKKFKISWNKVDTVSKIIRNHFSQDIQKVIVFCKNINHIKESIPLTKEWFEKSGVYNKINTFRTYASPEETINELAEFGQDVPNGEINILFAIDRVSEGIHIDGVNSVIFLRSTLSNNVLLQQLGRALAASSKATPIILDLINNLEILESNNFYNSINGAIDRINIEYKELGIPKTDISSIDVNFSIVDETKDFVRFLEDNLNMMEYSWDNCLEQAIECKKRTGWFPGPNTPDEDVRIINWVKRQRKLYSNGLLSDEKNARLNACNFYYSFVKEKWFYMFNRLVEYKKENNLETFFRHVISDKDIAAWVQNQRRRKIVKQMDSEEFNLLISIGVSFSLENDTWSYYIKRLDEFYKTVGHRVPTQSEDKELCIFSRIQRRNKREGKLTQDKIDLLNSIGFIWERVDGIIPFSERIESLKQYIAIYGDTKIPTRFEGFNNLGSWAGTMRRKKQSGKLSSEQVDALNELEFCWKVKESNNKERIDEIIEYTINKREDSSVSCDKSLSDAMNRIRRHYSNKTLSKKDIDKLNKVGFIWDPVSTTFDKRVKQLKEYHSIHGSFKVSLKSNFPDAKSLITWVNRQKTIYKSGTYSEEKERALLNIGFDLSKEITK